MLKRVGDTVSFLKRSYPLEEEGVSIRPGQYGENMVKAYEEKKGRLKSQQLPCDSTFHMEDSSSHSALPFLGWNGHLSLTRASRSLIWHQRISWQNVKTNSVEHAAHEEVPRLCEGHDPLHELCEVTSTMADHLFTRRLPGGERS